ncbi:glycosyltransferase involved in cell wall biosynthesis [Mycoplana sp. BE70]|uniref:glycosyltransferase n=1 Tax=Mycoplana sp. BE70 TaxID=2817775 RepID=UPI00285D0BBF|nr:glycosyltransferase [Mycoplana sp. BE70]MDR6757022.1 glycosyltransferase involved in cell wall biosynthesis [Mycoplana sp. BE70]
MGTLPALSVVIPHLNEPSDNLRQCLLALQAQRSDGISFEVIVVDNGSADLPAAVCASFPDVRLVSQPTPGPGPARNLGAAESSGDLLAFIDADCVAQPGWIKSLVGFLNGRPEVDLVGGDIGIRMTDPEKPTSIEAYESIYSYRARSYVERYGFAATGNMAVRRTVFEAVGPFGGISTMEDTEWGQKATSMGYRIAFVPEAKVLTPSCKSFAELSRRWDRHVAHEFRHIEGRRLGTLRWLLSCAVVAASPIGELAKVLASDRISGVGSRVGAMACLTRIRLYRAWLMVRLLQTRRQAALVDNWNRGD